MRLPRLDLPDYPQHLVHRGNNRERVFYGAEDYERFLVCLAEIAEDLAVAVHAYVLMPDHVHLLATQYEKGAVSRMMQRLGRRHVHYLNTRRRRTGGLWDNRFRSTIVEAGKYVLDCHRYIELNPVRADLVRDPEDYPYSSFHYYACGQTDPAITPHACYLALAMSWSRRRAIYRRLCEQPPDPETLAVLRHGTRCGWVVGSESFKQEVEAIAKRRVAPRRRGGPRSGAGRPRKLRGKP